MCTCGPNSVILRLYNARALADIARRFSASELRVSIEQNLFLPWVRVADLPDLFAALKSVSLADAGAETIADVRLAPALTSCRSGHRFGQRLGYRDFRFVFQWYARAAL